MFDLRFINVAADDTYCMAAAKVTRNLLAAECPLSGGKADIAVAP
jgi:hypothetical protein